MADGLSGPHLWKISNFFFYHSHSHSHRGSNYRIGNSGKASSFFFQWGGLELGLDEAPALCCLKKAIIWWPVYLFSEAQVLQLLFSSLWEPGPQSHRLDTTSDHFWGTKIVADGLFGLHLSAVPTMEPLILRCHWTSDEPMPWRHINGKKGHHRNIAYPHSYEHGGRTKPVLPWILLKVSCILEIEMAFSSVWSSHSHSTILQLVWRFLGKCELDLDYSPHRAEGKEV